jgi:hypothetical protein
VFDGYGIREEAAKVGGMFFLAGFAPNEGEASKRLQD